MNLTHNCAGLPRRDFLQLGVGGLGLAGLLQARSKSVNGRRRVGIQPECALGPQQFEGALHAELRQLFHL